MSPSVLIVDDDPDDREITLRMLRRFRAPLCCLQAESGESALALLAAGEALPALILMDLKMPGKSGLDTLRQIRGDLRLRHIPVVIVTHSTLDSDHSAALAAGADDFLHKSLDLSRYGREIGDRLDRWVCH